MRTPAPFVRRPNPHKSCPIAENAHPLARQFFELAAADRLALTDIAARAGISLGTLVKWKYRHAPNVITLDTVLRAIGYELVIQPIPE